MERAEVIVIGGGPGGSSCARNLALSGVDVLLLDRARFPRIKVCAGWITPPILHALQLHPEDYPCTMQAFSSGSVVLDDEYYHSHFKETVSFGIIRQEFDYFLLQRARNSGVRVIEDCNIRQLDLRGDSVWLLAADGQEFSAQLVVGAGGTGCPVAQKWGEKQPGESIVIAQESETRLGADRLKELTPFYGTTELFSEPDFSGYGWYVTKGDWLNIGLGRFRHTTANFNKERDRFLDTLRRLGRLQGIEKQIVSFQGHSYKLFDEVARRLSGDRFVLIGDAGGFASKWAGEGLRPAVETGQLAAGIIVQALATGDCSKERLSEYSRACQELYGEQKLSAAVRLLNLIPQKLKLALAHRLVKSDVLRRKYIFEYAFGFVPARLEKIPRSAPAIVG